MLEIGSHSFEGQGSARFDDTSFQARVAQQKRSEAGNTGEPDEKGAAYAQLREAIREGDTQAALALIKEGVTPYSGMAPTVGDPSNETSDLIFAAASGDAKLVRALLEPLSPPERGASTSAARAATPRCMPRFSAAMHRPSSI